jgi:peroxiredoxin
MISIRDQVLRFWLKNWRNLINSLFVHSLCIACLTAYLSILPASAGTKQIDTGDQFPNLIFKDALTKEARLYLSLSKKNNITLMDIKGSFFIFEIFNTYCTSCPKNVPLLNDIYSMTQNDLSLKGKIKVMGIAVGNNKKEAEMFIREHRVLYPVLTDYNFDAHKALGSPRVPYTVFVRRDDRRKNIVVYTHQGIFESAKDIRNKINEFL